MASYQERRQKYVTLKTRELLQALPPYIFDFFRGIEHPSSANTRLAYASDIRVYLYFLYEILPEFNGMFSIAAMTLEQLYRKRRRLYSRHIQQSSMLSSA